MVSLIAIALVFPCQYLYQVLLVQPLWWDGLASLCSPHNIMLFRKKENSSIDDWAFKSVSF